MRIRTLVFAVLCLAAQPVVAGTYKFTPKAGPRQEVEYEHGIGTTWSDAPNSEVKLAQVGTFPGKRLVFGLRVWKFTGKNLDIDITDIAPEYDGVPLHVYSASELRKIVDGRSAWAKAGNGFITGLSAGLATNRNTVRSSGRVGNTYYNSKYTIDTPDYQAQSDAYRRGDERSDRIDASRSATLRDIDSLALQRTTLKDDDDEYAFLFVTDRPEKLSGSMLTISVKVGEEVHSFTFDGTEE